MKLENIRISNSGNIVADHVYNERSNGVLTRRVATAKVIAKPNPDGTYSFVSTSEKGRELAKKFAKQNDIQFRTLIVKP